MIELMERKTALNGAPTPVQDLTRQLELARRGLVMNTTQKLGQSRNLWPKSSIPHRVAQRAISRFTVDENGCHISTYSIASHGYAQIGWQLAEGKNAGTTAHRAAWVAHTGKQIPAGMTIDHTCKSRRCVNPAHLRMLSNFENGRRTHGRDGAHPLAHPHTRKERRMTETFILDIPREEWLTQNMRLHWAQVARRKKAIRQRARLEARRQAIRPRIGKTIATILVGYPSARRADPENAAPTIKACIDGLVDSGVLPDDSAEFWAHGTDRDPNKTGPGMYRLTMRMEKER